MMKAVALKQKWHQYSLLLLVFLGLIISLLNPISVKAVGLQGELIDIGTHRLHINCKGHGSPTVVIDSGIGGFSLEWSTIQKELANDVRICSYDRAGYGWSDPGPRPRTTARIAKELKQLLTTANIPGPYILVGHSFGGYNVRYFASQYPELTAGMVLIDASHPEQFNTEEFKRIEFKSKPKYKNSYSVRIIRPIIAANYPAENKRTAYILMSTMKSRATLLQEMDYMEISAQQVAQQTNHAPYHFPVMILTRGMRVWAHNELGDRRELQWLRLQNDLENISIQSQHDIAHKSGHIIHLDQPALVTANIRSTILKARSQQFEYDQIKEYDIRYPSVASTSSFDYKMDIETGNPLGKQSIWDKSFQNVVFDNDAKNFVNRSRFFMR